MKIILFLFFILFAEARTIKIASYNVENLFDMRRDGTEYVEYIPGRHGWSRAMLEKKLHNLTEVICDMEADVIGLQEVENDNALALLQRSLERAGCEYRYRAITSSKETPIHNAILSKIAIAKKRDVVVGRYGRRRSILEVALKTDPPLKVFNNHWKSKRGPESERIPYAKALKKRLERLPIGTEYVLLGDFNSNYNESVTIDKKHNDTNNVTGINNILKTTRDDGRMVRLGDMRSDEHANLWMELPSGARWSHNFFGDKEGIDSIILPQTLHNKNGWEYMSNSYAVFKPHYLFGNKGRVNRWTYRHSKHLGRGYSDHLPIYAKFVSSGYGTKEISKDSKSWWQELLDYFSDGLKAVAPKQKVAQGIASIISPKNVDIHTLKTMKKINEPVRLEGVHVVFKRGDSAVISQNPSGESILLYRSALQLEEGGIYDILVYKKKRYKGLDELTDIEAESNLGKSSISSFVMDFSHKMMKDEKYIGTIVKNITGILDKHSITIGKRQYRIHFRKSAGHPKQGVSVEINRAMIGYYKDHMEFIIWSKNDYKAVK